MNKKDEALAKFVEVVKNLSSKEFEEKYVKEDIPVSKLLIRTKGVWKGNLKVINDNNEISQYHDGDCNIAIHSAIDGTKKIHFHMEKVKTDDFGIDIEIEPQ